MQAVDGAHLEVAAANMRTFAAEVAAAAEREAITRAEIDGRPDSYTAVVGEPERDEASDHDGRYGWRLSVNGRDQVILMPGVDLDQVRGLTLAAPCVIVNGSPWWWSDAVGHTVPLPERHRG